MPMMRTWSPPAARILLMICVRLATVAGKLFPRQEATAPTDGRITQEPGSLAPMSMGDQRDPATVGAKKADRRSELGAARVGADPAVDHRVGGLAGAAELDQPQAGVAAAQRGVKLVGVTLPGREAGSRRVGLDSPGQRITERQVVAGLRAGLASWVAGGATRGHHA